MEATSSHPHPLGNWKLRSLPCAHVTMSDGQGRCWVGTQPALLYLPGGRRREVLFRHAERINLLYFVPVN